MTLNQLEQFVTVAKMMNISRAAEELYVSHSSISRNISLLEEELQTRLIVRDNKISSLTKAGTVLANRAEFILEYVDEMKREVRVVDENASLSLNIITNSFEDARILKIFSDFRKAHPEAYIHVDDADGPLNLKKLQERKTDILFTFSFALVEPGQNICSMKLYDDEFVALVSEYSPLANLEYLDAQTPMDEPALYLDNANYEFVSKLLPYDRSTEEDYPHLKCDSIEQLLAQLKYSGKWALVPRNIAEQNLAHCRIIPVRNTDRQFSVLMCWNKQNTNRLLRPFLDAVKDVFPEDRAEEPGQAAEGRDSLTG